MVGESSMTCRYCGAKLGLVERWRYGDFCSKEHKEEFATENQRLAEERLKSLRRPGDVLSIGRIVETEPEDSAAELKAEKVESTPAATAISESGNEGEIETTPELQEFVEQHKVQPLAAAPAPPPPEPPPSRTQRRDWKYLAKVADFEALPVSVAGASSKNFRTMELPAKVASGIFMMPPMRRAFIPEPFEVAVRARPAQMPRAELQQPEAYREQRWASAPDPIGLAPKTWVDESGRRWVFSAPAATQVAVYPGISRVLEHYPLAEPWADWPLEEWGRGKWSPSAAKRAAAAKESLAPIAPISPAPIAVKSARPAGPPATAGPSGPAGPVGVGNAHTADQPARPQSRLRQPEETAGQTAVSPAAPGSPGGSLEAGRRGGASKWQPLVPPIFRALVDIAHDMEPVPLPSGMWVWEVEPLRFGSRPVPEKPEDRGCPRIRQTLRSGRLVRVNAPGAFRLAAGCAAGQPAFLSIDGSRIQLPVLQARPEKPGLPQLPRYLRIHLPVLDRWHPSQSEPAVFLGGVSR